MLAEHVEAVEEVLDRKGYLYLPPGDPWPDATPDDRSRCLEVFWRVVAQLCDRYYLDVRYDDDGGIVVTDMGGILSPN